MRKSLRPEISQLQFGFVPDKSTRNAIFTLSMLAERCIEMQKDLYLCFIDYSKAFDKVRHEKLFNILEHLDIDGKDLRVIRNLYWDQSAAVRIGGELSEYTLIKRGVRQGCVMSPDLFNIYSEMILRNLENYPGVKINGENINNIRYADDTVLIADSEENLQNLLDITIEKSEEMGLTLNVKSIHKCTKSVLKFQQSSSLRSKPFAVDVMIINGNGQQIQVCNLLILNTKNVVWPNWHVVRHLTKTIEISLKKMSKSHPKSFWGVGNF